MIAGIEIGIGIGIGLLIFGLVVRYFVQIAAVIGVVALVAAVIIIGAVYGAGVAVILVSGLVLLGLGWRYTVRAEEAKKIKERAEHLKSLASDPLENYDHARSYLAAVENCLATQRLSDKDRAMWTGVAAQVKAIVAACERAQRIERIADLQDSIASSEKISAIVASGDIPDWWDKNFAAQMTDPAERARSAKYVEEMKADLIAAKTGPLTWYTSDDDRWYKDANGKVHRSGPRGLGLSVAKVAAAEAYLDGFARVEAEPVDGGRWSTAFAQRMALAANRGVAV